MLRGLDADTKLEDNDGDHDDDDDALSKPYSDS